MMLNGNARQYIPDFAAATGKTRLPTDDSLKDCSKIVGGSRALSLCRFVWLISW